LIKAHGGRSFGARSDKDINHFSLYVLSHTKMAAVLTESGFMDYQQEAERMLDPKFQKADAEATCRGICKYFGVAYKKEITSTSPTKNTWKKGDYNCKVRATANLNLRTGRGTNNKIIYTIPKGTIFEVGYVYKNWGSTWDFKGRAGYFCCDYIEKV